MGQIYSPERYGGRIGRRTHAVGGKPFAEEVAPVESVEEYFDHFAVLELDFTYYRPLCDEDGNPTSNHRLLQQYRSFLGPGDRVLLKVPREVFARRVRLGSGYAENDAYLNPGLFRRRFYEPAVEILGEAVGGFVFEQEYHREADRLAPERLAESLDAFFASVPKDDRYQVELRTPTYLAGPVFEVFQGRGIGQVLSHWTWLPPLMEQFSRSGRRFFNSGGRCLVRLMTPRGVRYEAAYARAHPFDKLIVGMIQPKMVEDTVAILGEAIKGRVHVDVIVNNRSAETPPSSRS
jgi:hypothetical protein